MNLKSFLMGLSLGLSGKPLPLSGGEPVAYLYNGVRLPKLPDRDEQTYPHLVILRVGSEPSYAADATTAECYIKTETASAGNKLTRLYLGSTGLSLAYASDKSKYWYHDQYVSGETVRIENEWRTWEYNNNYRQLHNGYEVKNVIVWSNHDILNEDGSVYFAKCDDPIPVYE